MMPLCVNALGTTGHLPVKATASRRVLHVCSCSDEASSSGPDKVEVGWLWASGTSAATPRNLKKQGFKPKKSLGQNFVTNDGYLQRIATGSGIVSGEPVLELGPGTGNLSKHLLEAGAKLTVVEKDDRLQEQFREDFGDDVRVIHGDIMKVNYESIVKEMLADDDSTRQVRVVSNLPYNLTTACLQRMLPMSHCFSLLYFMIQDEVAKRLCMREPGPSEYRAMTIYTQFYSDPTYLFRIPKGVYYPQPKVNGALVEFALKPKQERSQIEDDFAFIRMVNQSFSEKRKMLRNSLSSLYPQDAIIKALAACGLKDTARAQELTLAQFISLYNALLPHQSNLSPVSQL